jgi:hypothetical protein
MFSLDSPFIEQTHSTPTLASESFIIKLSGFWYVVAVALASGGLVNIQIRALSIAHSHQS